MPEYAMRLTACGMPPHEAYKTVWDFIKHFGAAALEEYVQEVERLVAGV